MDSHRVMRMEAELHRMRESLARIEEALPHLAKKADLTTKTPARRRRWLFFAVAIMVAVSASIATIGQRQALLSWLTYRLDEAGAFLQR
jgi:hypothetical protein